jgi:hypothetical protein
MSTPLTLEQMQSFVTYINNAFGKRPYTLSLPADFTAGKVLVATGGGFGVEPVDVVTLTAPSVKMWQPETDYSAGTADVANDLVIHGDSLYIVTQDHTSGTSFNERLGLARVGIATDPEYLEITADASSPITTGQIISRYRGIRNFTIMEQYTLPNANLDAPRAYNTAVCNGSITTPTVVTIERLESITDYTAIATITFTPNADPYFTQGVIAFNDAYMGPTANTTGLYMPIDTVLVMRVTTVGTGLEWVSINLLGEFISYTNPNFNLPD